MEGDVLAAPATSYSRDLIEYMTAGACYNWFSVPGTASNVPTLVPVVLFMFFSRLLFWNMLFYRNRNTRNSSAKITSLVKIGMSNADWKTQTFQCELLSLKICKTLNLKSLAATANS